MPHSAANHGNVATTFNGVRVSTKHVEGAREAWLTRLSFSLSLIRTFVHLKKEANDAAVTKLQLRDTAQLQIIDSHTVPLNGEKFNQRGGLLATGSSGCPDRNIYIPDTIKSCPLFRLPLHEVEHNNATSVQAIFISRDLSTRWLLYYIIAWKLIVCRDIQRREIFSKSCYHGKKEYLRNRNHWREIAHGGKKNGLMQL